MTVYLDIILIENILMNYIILFGVGSIQKKKMKNIRLIISSIMGAMYAVISYLGIIPIYSNPILKIVLSIIMIYIAFNPKDIKIMVKTLLLFYLMSFVIGGCAFAMLYIVSPENVKFKNGVLVGTYPMKITIIAGIIGFTIIQYCFAINKMKLKHNDLLCNIKIRICNKQLETKAFIDSGNNLRDPITSKPVVIIEKQKISSIINIDKLEKQLGGDNRVKICFIPFKSIGKQNGMMLGIISEYVQIEYQGETSIINGAILGIYDKKISKNYSALIGLELLNGGYYDEDNINTKETVL